MGLEVSRLSSCVNSASLDSYCTLVCRTQRLSHWRYITTTDSSRYPSAKYWMLWFKIASQQTSRGHFHHEFLVLFCLVELILNRRRQYTGMHLKTHLTRSHALMIGPRLVQLLAPEKASRTIRFAERSVMPGLRTRQIFRWRN